MPQKSLKANAFLNTLKTVLTLFFPLITFPYSSRVLGPDNIGKVNFAQSVVSYFAIVASLGISTYATREAAKVRDNPSLLNKIATEIFLINMAATIVSYALLAVALVFVGKFDDYRLLIIICSSLIIFTTVGMGWLYQAVEDYFYITIRSLVFQVVSVVLLFALVKTKEDYAWYAAVNVISNVGANILNFFHSRKYIRFSFKSNFEIKKHLKSIFVLFATTIVGSIFASIDTTMLGFLSSDSEVGFYSAGMKLIHMVNGIFPAMIIVIFPRVSYYFASGDEKSILHLSSKTVNFLLCFSMPIAVGLCLLMNPLVLVFCGGKYIEAVSVAQTMCPYLIFSALGHFFGGTILVAKGKEKQQLYSLLFSVSLDVVLNFLLIRGYGAKGAAFATLISQVVMTLTYMLLLHDFIRRLSIKFSFLQFFLSSLVMGISVCFVRNLFSNLILQIFVPFVAGVAVYATMLFVLRNRMFLEACGDVFRKFRKR